jgi:DNA (cytosine-5)-methyltransferase 1
MLDLFAGAGGSAVGYARAGFTIVGVDCTIQPLYPFDFVQADVFSLPERWESGWAAGFDAIHASPPCQAYSVATRDKTRHRDLIGHTRRLLEATGLPYVIENVPGAPLRAPVTICGSSLGLKIRRHRLFETNWPLIVPPCAHGQQGQPVGVYGEGSSKGQVRGRKADNEAQVLEAMGMPWADRKSATQAVHPDFTELIGHQLIQHLKAQATA